MSSPEPLPTPSGETERPRESITQLLGGGRAALEASVPPVVFVAAWLLSGGSMAWACGASIASALVLAVVSWAQGRKPRAVLMGLLLVVASASVAARTGDAANFFLLRVLANAGSSLAWAVSIVIRWPLLGVILGTMVGTRTRWRQDPALLRAYSLASWLWVGQFALRVVVFGILWWTQNLVGLGVAQIVLSYPLMLTVLALSGVVLFRSIPRGHPGIRHPQANRPGVSGPGPERD